MSDRGVSKGRVKGGQDEAVGGEHVAGVIGGGEGQVDWAIGGGEEQGDGAIGGGMGGRNIAEEENTELLLVNGKEVTVCAELHVKSKLSEFCQKQNIPLAKYEVSVVNANNTPLQYFTAIVKADERSALGTGRNKKMAQTVAARAFLNNRFLPENYNSQAGTPVCNPVVNPAKKKRQIVKMGKWVEKQESLRSQKSKICEGVKENIDLEQPGKMKSGNYIFFDLERAGGNIESEIIQIGYTDGKRSESIFIQPRGKISMHSSKYSHKMRLNNSGKLVTSTGVPIKCSSLFEAAEQFIKFIKKKKDESEEDLSLIFYGGDDDICLLNNFAAVNMDEIFSENVEYFLNFQDMIKDDNKFNECVSLTKLQPNKKNVAQQILGPSILEDLSMSHDASFDADLLRRVFSVYVKSWSYGVDMRTYMIPSRDSLIRAQLVVGRLSEKRKRKGSTYEFLTFNGWK